MSCEEFLIPKYNLEFNLLTGVFPIRSRIFQDVYTRKSFSPKNMYFQFN